MNNKIFSRGIIAIALLSLASCASQISRADALARLKEISEHSEEVVKFTMTADMVELESSAKVHTVGELRYSEADLYVYSSSTVTKADGSKTVTTCYITVEDSNVKIVNVVDGTASITNLPGGEDVWKVSTASFKALGNVSKSTAASLYTSLSEMGSASLEEGQTEYYTSSGSGNIYLEGSITESGVVSKESIQFDNYKITKSSSSMGEESSSVSYYYDSCKVEKYSA